MTPTTLLRAQGSPATWLLNSTKDHRPDRPGEYRYLVSSLDQSAIADLALLALEHWQIRVGRGPSSGLRVTVTRPTGIGVRASTSDPSDRSLRQRTSPPDRVGPSRTRARAEAVR